MRFEEIDTILNNKNKSDKTINIFNDTDIFNISKNNTNINHKKINKDISKNIKERDKNNDHEYDDDNVINIIEKYNLKWTELSKDIQLKKINEYFATIDRDKIIDFNNVKKKLIDKLNKDKLGMKDIEYDKVNERIIRFKKFNINDNGTIFYNDIDNEEQILRKKHQNIRKIIKNIYK